MILLSHALTAAGERHIYQRMVTYGGWSFRLANMDVDGSGLGRIVFGKVSSESTASWYTNPASYRKLSPHVGLAVNSL